MTWHDRARCAGEPTEIFYPGDHSGGGVSPDVRWLCERCPVAAECLEEALSTPESSDYGIWAGTTARERTRIRRARAQRRPA